MAFSARGMPSNSETCKWCVLVDGSAVSGRAFDCVVSFLGNQNGSGLRDELCVMHAFDSKEDANKPYHLRGQSILNSYDTTLIRARRQYDSRGPQMLLARTRPAKFNKNDEDIEVAKLEYYQNQHTVEKAPPIVASILNELHKEVHPHYLFMGSFGTGGKKVGSMGSVTDYIARLANSTTCIVKHWRPVPKDGEIATFLVAIDDSPASMKALDQIFVLAKPHDKIIGITVSRHEGPKDKEIMEHARSKIASFGANAGPDAPEAEVHWKKLEEGQGNAAEHLIRFSDELEADYLVLGSFNTAHGAPGRDSMISLGSTALYCSQNCKCHAIVVKPPREKGDYQHSTSFS